MTLLVQLQVGGEHCLPSPWGSLSPHFHPVSPHAWLPWAPQGGREGDRGAAQRGRGAGGWHLVGGGTGHDPATLVQPPPNRQGCLTPNVFQPRPQANFNFLVIMQMNVDLIKGRFH